MMFAVAPRFLFCRRSSLLAAPATSRWYSTPAGVRSVPLLQELRARGLVAEVTSEGLAKQLQSPTVLYTGFDPTATSLHVGNLITLLGLLHFHLRGHKVIVVVCDRPPCVGGATGSIGDPSGRSSERNALSREVLERNVDCIRSQLDKLLSTAAVYAANRPAGRQRDDADSKVDAKPVVLNNLDWFASIPVLDFLGGIGRHARINSMLDRESVKTRLDSLQGMSFTEFSYQLLQAYDFWHLHKTYECTSVCCKLITAAFYVQLGGSDQWGNINAGRDLIHRKYVEEGTADRAEREPEIFGLTIPLLTTSSGEKFGKSAGNAVWLDEQQTSVYDFYQVRAKRTS
ncbi:MAG: tyrosyl-tRNA synthetase [Olpidium bornovanus]|uniref:tyrosine--tRNA ligase n=1 Tax=Olpidium bornovanus TaxID=278681 RepID=A0A8H8DJB5_9FUNG|nr:MAG: tyrosyl-tRNA synthetase [Olpidium bornovanus]